VALDGSGVAHPSDVKGPLGAGSYGFKASIAGDVNYNGDTSACEPLTVNKADLTITTAIHNVTLDDHTTDIQGTSVPLGTSVDDQATVTGIVAGFPPANNAVFTFFTSTCTTGSSAAGSVALDGSGVAHPSDVKGPLGAAGSYGFKASIAGDANYNGDTSACEPLTVDKEPTDVSTAPKLLPNDSAELSGGYGTLTGSLTFKLFVNDSECSGDPAYEKTVTVNGYGPYVTDNTTVFVTADSIIRWTADYTGDGNNEGSSSGCTEEVIDIDFNP